MRARERINDAIRRNHGMRFCTTCQRDKPAEGFIQLRRYRPICGDCANHYQKPANQGGHS